MGFNYGTNVDRVFHENSSLGNSLYGNYSESEFGWGNNSILNRFMGTRLTLSNSHTPLYSNNPDWRNIGYDRVTKNSPGETPTVLGGKEELAPEYLFSPYWYSHYKNLNLKHSYNSAATSVDKMSRFYIPHVLDYSEYDFRNSQAQESLEDAFWESNHSAFFQEDYVSARKDFGSYGYFNKPKTLYNLANRILNKKPYHYQIHVLGSSGLKFITDNNLLTTERYTSRFSKDFYYLIKYFW